MSGVYGSMSPVTVDIRRHVINVSLSMSQSAVIDDETRPLISGSDLETQCRRQHVGLPKLQLTTLLVAYFAETVITVFAYPFIFEVSPFTSGVKSIRIS